MFKRPLLPVLVSFILGILAGHSGLSRFLPPDYWIFMPIACLLLFTLLIPHRSRTAFFLLIFFLLGLFLMLNRSFDSTLLPLAEKRERIVMEGTVLEPGRFSEDRARYSVRVDKGLIAGRERGLNEKCRITIYNHAGHFSPGDKIRFSAKLRPFKNFNNPGRYDYELAMKLGGFSCAGSVSDGRSVVPMGRGSLGFPRETLEGVRSQVRTFLQEKLPPSQSILLGALILGEKQAITPDLREAFGRSGLGHVLAVSGLHIGLVAWFAFFLSRGLLSLSYRLTLRWDIRKVAAVITLVPVVTYVCLTGFQVSGQRAMIMVLVYLFSIIMDREKDVWSTLALAALLVLALEPGAIFSISFQLSFMAVLGILLLTPAIYDRIPSPFGNSGGRLLIIKHLYEYVTGLIAVTLGAVLFLLPITFFYFHRISLVSIPANIMAVPVLGLWVLPLGLVSAFCLPLFTDLSNLFLVASVQGLEWMMGIIDFWAGLPWASFWVITPSLFEIILFYGLFCFLLSFKRRVWARYGTLFVFLLFTGDIAYWVYQTQFNPDLKITYLDVGQGNAALVRFPGNERMLIDGGGFGRDTFDVGEMVLAPFLFRLKIRRIDYLVLSHPHPDHMNGLRFIAAHFNPKEFWYNGDQVEDGSWADLMEIVETKKIIKYAPSDLKEPRIISGVNLELLHPLSKGDGRIPRVGRGYNDNSLVLKLSYGGKSFLFPGDLEKRGERIVTMNEGERLKSDVLLAPHHGSKSSCSKTFLDMVRPDISVISSGSGNYHGLPHHDTLRKLNEIGSRVIRIDQAGAVQISVGPDKLVVSCYGDPFR